MSWTSVEPSGAVYGEEVYTQANTTSGGQYRCIFWFGYIPGTKTVVIKANAQSRASSSSFAGSYSNGPAVSVDGVSYTNGTITSEYSGGTTWYSRPFQYWVSENVPRGQMFYCKSVNGGKPPVTFTFVPGYSIAHVMQDDQWKDAEANVLLDSMKPAEVKVMHNGAWRDTV